MVHRSRVLFAVAAVGCAVPSGPGGGGSPAPPPATSTSAVAVLDLDGQEPTWFLGAQVMGVTPLGDLDSDGRGDFSVVPRTMGTGAEPEYVVLGDPLLPRVLGEDAIPLAPYYEYPNWHSALDIDGDRVADLGRHLAAGPTEYLRGPIAPLTPEAVLAAPSMATAPDWGAETWRDASGLLGFRRDEADGGFTFVPGPAANWEVGAGALAYTWEAVNSDPNPDECAWTVPYPQIVAVGDLDSDGDAELVLYPFGYWETFCADQHGYLVPEPMPTSAHFDLTTGIAGWAKLTQIEAIPDQTGDGINDALLWVEGDSTHLVVGPVLADEGVLTHGGDLGRLLSDATDIAGGKPVPDVTGDGIMDWITFDAADGSDRCAVLRPGGVDALFDPDPPTLAAWTTWQDGANFSVSGDLILFPTASGVVVLDLLP